MNIRFAKLTVFKAILAAFMLLGLYVGSLHAQNADSITISNVQAVAKDGKIAVTIEVNYNLASKDNAVIMVGYNDKNNTGFTMLLEEKDISKGSGVEKLVVEIPAEAWNETPKRLIYVNIAPKEKDSGSFRPLANCQTSVTINP